MENKNICMEEDLISENFQIILPISVVKRIETNYSDSCILKEVKEFFIDKLKNEKNIMSEYFEYIPTILFLDNIVTSMVESDMSLEKCKESSPIGVITTMYLIYKLIYSDDEEANKTLEDITLSLKNVLNKEKNKKEIIVCKIKRIGFHFLLKLRRCSLMDVAKVVSKDCEVKRALKAKLNEETAEYNIEDASFKLIVELLVSILLEKSIKDSKVFSDVNINLNYIKQKVIYYINETDIVQ